MPYKQWTSGELVSAPDFQSYVQDQAVAQFPSASARTAAMPTPIQGQLSWLDDIAQMQVYRSTPVAGWYPAGGTLPFMGLRLVSDWTAGGTGWQRPTGLAAVDVQGGMAATGDFFTLPWAGIWRVTARVSWNSSAVTEKYLANSATATAPSGNTTAFVRGNGGGTYGLVLNGSEFQARGAAGTFVYPFIYQSTVNPLQMRWDVEWVGTRP